MSTSKAHSTALTAVALQDHLMRSMSLSWVDPIKQSKKLVKRHTTTSIKKNVKPVVNTGRVTHLPKPKVDSSEKEYVIGPKPLPITLAQKLGLVDAPSIPLSETEWQKVKAKSNDREDSSEPCVICKEEFGTQRQVLLSCSHVFHKACLEAFERFAGKKTCPMCRKEQYQKRVIHEGAKHFKNECATKIQSLWRGYQVRCWYRRLRETTPPNDPNLRKKFYENKLTKVTDRMVDSYDCDVKGFLRQLDQELEASRDIFRHFDGILKQISEEEWEEIQIKAVVRGVSDCPICLTSLDSQNLMAAASKLEHAKSENPKPKNSPTSTSQYSDKQIQKHEEISHPLDEDHCNYTPRKAKRSQVLLSCSHMFHQTCLEAFEEFSVGERRNVCPVCRSSYQKRCISEIL